MADVNLLEWLNESWLLLCAVVAGIAVIFELAKQIKQIKEVIEQPIVEIKSDVETIKATTEVQNRAILSIQRKSLKDSFDKCIQKGYITTDEFETLTKQYESYTELGGNSFIHKLYEDVSKLPKRVE